MVDRLQRSQPDLPGRSDVIRWAVERAVAALRRRRCNIEIVAGWPIGCSRLQMRVTKEFLGRVDELRRAAPDPLPGRSEVIRWAVERAVAALPRRR
jgi:metal-responsive CopG/Arc/MetJ family transcriptional regulator